MRIIGLSPRLRGNLYGQSDGRLGNRSIPAPAGEPSLRQRRKRASGVYPRACGGTSSTSRPITRTPGLSPRLRGNPIPRRRQHRPDGSIPAPAGEPETCCTFRTRASVYPRACGGTPPGYRAESMANGLSPRLRGNQPLGELRPALCGSIPAPAGEPTSAGG